MPQSLKLLSLKVIPECFFKGFLIFFKYSAFFNYYQNYYYNIFYSISKFIIIFLNPIIITNMASLFGLLDNSYPNLNNFKLIDLVVYFNIKHY